MNRSCHDLARLRSLHALSKCAHKRAEVLESFDFGDSPRFTAIGAKFNRVIKDFLPLTAALHDAPQLNIQTDDNGFVRWFVQIPRTKHRARWCSLRIALRVTCKYSPRFLPPFPPHIFAVRILIRVKRRMERREIRNYCHPSDLPCELLVLHFFPCSSFLLPEFKPGLRVDVKGELSTRFLVS